MDTLGFSAQQTGGIFGYHGTGTGAVFSVVQSVFCLGVYLSERKLIYLPLAIFLSIPIITGFAYGGFVLMLIAIIIWAGRYLKLSKIVKILIIGTTAFMTLIILTKALQSDREYSSYFSSLTNLDSFLHLTVKDPNKERSFGRIGSISFAGKQVTMDLLTFILGNGPGSISYMSYTFGGYNPVMERFGLKGPPNLISCYIFELGFWGIISPPLIFFLLFKKWKQTEISSQSRFMKDCFANIPVLFSVYFIGLAYTSVLTNYFLVIFFAINSSYLNYLYKSQKGNQKNKATSIRPRPGFTQGL